MSESDFYSSTRRRGVKVDSNNEFGGYVYFRGGVPSNVIMEIPPKSIKKPVWNEESKKWNDKG